MPSLYGIIGHPLSHSFSPAFFKKKFTDQHIDAVYNAYEIASVAELPDLIKNNPELKGLNVTLPYKEAAIDYLDELDTVAGTIGAVNCIAIHDGRLTGYNTDAEGFELSLVPRLQSQHSYALILGTGGASKAVAYSLKQLGIPFQFVSRHKEHGTITYGEVTADMIAEHKLIINTTPLGMYPHIEEEPEFPYAALTDGHLLYDLIYNPEETKFLAHGRERGASIMNGFEMLQLQAEASWRIWMTFTDQPIV